MVRFRPFGMYVLSGVGPGCQSRRGERRSGEPPIFENFRVFGRIGRQIRQARHGRLAHGEAAGGRASASFAPFLFMPA